MLAIGQQATFYKHVLIPVEPGQVLVVLLINPRCGLISTTGRKREDNE
jgi:hypothetical protein